MCFPVLDPSFIALRSPFDRFLEAVAQLARQMPTMIGMIAHAELLFDRFGQSPAIPDLPVKSIGWRPFRQHSGDLCLLLCPQARRGSFRRMRFEGFLPSFSPTFHPLTDGSLRYSQRLRDVFLLPSHLFEFPGTFAPLFSPIGFLWCSHPSFFWPSALTLSRALSPDQEMRGDLGSLVAEVRKIPGNQVTTLRDVTSQALFLS
jgi:hypothetical protein